MTLQVGRHGRAVADVARDLGCGWHTVMDAVVAVGEQLIDHPDRIGTVNALGLDETLFARVGRFRTQLWSTQIVDVRRGQLLDVVPGRDSVEPCRWLAARDDTWRAGIEWATLDLSASYRTVFDTMLPDAVQVADPFHVVKLANTALDECRRRVQNETLGHRGRRDDPLWRARRRLSIARERLSADQHDRLMGLLRAGDPHQEVWFAWNAKEVVRQIYDHTDAELAAAVELAAATTVRPFAVYAQKSYALPKSVTKPLVWERAIEIFHGPILDDDRAFIHRDFYPGNVLWQRKMVSGFGRLGSCECRPAVDGRRPLPDQSPVRRFGDRRVVHSGMGAHLRARVPSVGRHRHDHRAARLRTPQPASPAQTVRHRSHVATRRQRNRRPLEGRTERPTISQENTRHHLNKRTHTRRSERGSP